MTARFPAGRRQVLAAGVWLAATGTAGAGPPPKALSLLVGAAAGASTDQQARAFAPFLERQVQASIELINLPGDAGLTALRQLSVAPADGSVLGWVSTPLMPARMVDRGGGDLMRRLSLLGAVQREPVAIVSPAAAPLDSVQDLFRRAADDPDAPPLGTPPTGSAPYLAALRLQNLAGKPLNLVSFPNISAVRQAVIAGNLGAAALALGDAIDALRDNRLVAIGIAMRDRVAVLPDTPSLGDAGLPLSSPILRGLAAPAALPDALAETIRAAMRAVRDDPEYGAQADANGFAPVWIDGADWMQRAIREQTELADLWRVTPWVGLGAG